MERSKESALLALPDSVGVEVGRIGGAPPGLEEQLRQGLEDALQRRGLPASRQGGNLLSYTVTGQVELATTPEGYRPAGLDWELRAWDGSLAARIVQDVEVDPDAALPVLLERLADRIARQIRKEGRNESEPVRLRISVAPISGAAAEATAPLLRAVETALASHGLEVVPPAVPSHLHVFGNAEIGPVHAGLRELQLGWVVKWSDGVEVGRVDQANAVPAEWLAGAWNSIAAAAAAGAASGISELAVKAQLELRPSGAAAGRSPR
ncbi:MAG: hypothetical protein F4Y03_05055 [Alphaproteobacteria bacterium]|nr:hypothetical protein [Alphaproteobacteria bacterium]